MMHSPDDMADLLNAAMMRSPDDTADLLDASHDNESDEAVSRRSRRSKTAAYSLSKTSTPRSAEPSKGLSPRILHSAPAVGRGSAHYRSDVEQQCADSPLLDADASQASERRAGGFSKPPCLTTASGYAAALLLLAVTAFAGRAALEGKHGASQHRIDASALPERKLLQKTAPAKSSRVFADERNGRAELGLLRSERSEAKAAAAPPHRGDSSERLAADAAFRLLTAPRHTGGDSDEASKRKATRWSDAEVPSLEDMVRSMRRASENEATFLEARRRVADSTDEPDAWTTGSDARVAHPETGRAARVASA